MISFNTRLIQLYLLTLRKGALDHPPYERCAVFGKLIVHANLSAGGENAGRNWGEYVELAAITLPKRLNTKLS